MQLEHQAAAHHVPQLAIGLSPVPSLAQHLRQRAAARASYDRFEAAEEAKIVELLMARFELDDGAAESLIETARERVDHSTQLFGFTRVVNDRFSQDERIELMEMLWQVAYADGRLDDYEASLMRRLAGLIHVSDRENGEARKKALAHLGLEA